MTSDAFPSMHNSQTDEQTENPRKSEQSASFNPEPFLDTEEAAAIMKIHP